MLYHLRRKRKPHTVRLNLVTSRTPRGQGRIKISRVSVPLVQTVTQTPSQIQGKQFDEDAGEPEQMDLYLHHERGTPVALQQCHGSKKRTHECREEKAAESWARLRKGLLTSLIESCSHPAELQCYMCSTESSQVYCQDCGGYVCIECAQKLHTNMNVFHTPVMWKVSIDPLQLHNVLRKSLHTSEYVPPSLCTTTMAV